MKRSSLAIALSLAGISGPAFATVTTLAEPSSDSTAARALGQAYLDGSAGRQSTEQGLRWLNEAAERGDVYAHYQLAEHYARQPGAEAEDQTLVHYRAAARLGHTDAQWKLGDLLIRMGATPGTTPTDAERLNLEGIALIEHAASAGNRTAMRDLAYRAARGRGMPADAKIAGRWLRAAADAGDGPSALQVARTLAKSEDPAQRAQALHYLTIAADAQLPDAVLELATWHEYGTFGPKNHARALARANEAVALKAPGSKALLARLSAAPASTVSVPETRALTQAPAPTRAPLRGPHAPSDATAPVSQPLVQSTATKTPASSLIVNTDHATPAPVCSDNSALLERIAMLRARLERLQGPSRSSATRLAEKSAAPAHAMLRATGGADAQEADGAAILARTDTDHAHPPGECQEAKALRLQVEALQQQVDRIQTRVANAVAAPRPPVVAKITVTPPAPVFAKIAPPPVPTLAPVASGKGAQPSASHHVAVEGPALIVKAKTAMPAINVAQDIAPSTINDMAIVALRAKDTVKAVGYLNVAAERGDVNAMNNLGMLYLRGTGVDRDRDAAVHWFTTAAERGNAAAAGNLGYLYAHGLGVNPDLAQAITWYRKSVALGNHAGVATLHTLQGRVGKDGPVPAPVADHLAVSVR